MFVPAAAAAASSSGTAGGTLATRRTRGGLELRNELERATCEVFGSTIPGCTIPDAIPPPTPCCDCIEVPPSPVIDGALVIIMVLLLLLSDVVSALLLL